MSLQDILGLSESDGAPKRHPLWTVIGPPTENINIAQPLCIPPHLPVSSKDKTATSLRLLLCEVQSSLENFSTGIQGLARDVECATVHIEETLKFVEDRQDTAIGDLKSLCKRLLFVRGHLFCATLNSQLSRAKPSNSHEIKRSDER
jgi:hypothetical protein